MENKVLTPEELSKIKKAQKNETQEKMQVIYNSMGKFLLRNQRLPCPARLILSILIIMIHKN